MKKKIFDIIQIGDKSNLLSRSFDWFITIVILLNILVVFLQTFDELYFLNSVFLFVEYSTTLIFIVEYLLRIWTADFLYPKESHLKSRLHFMRSFNGVVDLLTILPAFFLSGFVVFRMLRVVRIFHLFRINVKYDSLSVITSVLYEKKNQIVSSVFIILLLMLASSLCMYSAEHDAQPDIFKNAFSGVWWSVSTLLTVGYGDIYPITVVGKCMAILIAFLGVGVVAIPTGIISAGFVEQYQRTSELSNYNDVDIKDIIEFLADTSYAGKSVEDISSNHVVYLIIRNDLSILPRPDTIIELNDIIVCKVN